MKFYSKKEPTGYIKVAMIKNKIIVKNGFVLITKGDHYGHRTIRTDLFESFYTIPENITFKD